MQIENRNETIARLAEAFESGRIRVEREIGSRYASPQVRVEQGVTEMSFSLGRDGIWRFSHMSTYGNGEFVGGDGCDASGLRLPQSFVDRYIAPLGSFQTYSG